MRLKRNHSLFLPLCKDGRSSRTSFLSQSFVRNKSFTVDLIFAESLSLSLLSNICQVIRYSLVDHSLDSLDVNSVFTIYYSPIIYLITALFEFLLFLILTTRVSDSNTASSFILMSTHSCKRRHWPN